MAFSAAFAAARKKLGPGKTFTYKGKKYSTNRADDKKSAGASPKKATSPRPKARPTRAKTPATVKSGTRKARPTVKSGTRKASPSAKSGTPKSGNRGKTTRSGATPKSGSRGNLTMHPTRKPTASKPAPKRMSVTKSFWKRLFN